MDWSCVQVRRQHIVASRFFLYMFLDARFPRLSAACLPVDKRQAITHVRKMGKYCLLSLKNTITANQHLTKYSYYTHPSSNTLQVLIQYQNHQHLSLPSRFTLHPQPYTTLHNPKAIANNEYASPTTFCWGVSVGRHLGLVY